MSICKLLHKMYDHVDQMIERQQYREELNTMSDRELADIGITRGDIENVVDGSYGDPRR